jgi:molecular chaperone GrpE
MMMSKKSIQTNSASEQAKETESPEKNVDVTGGGETETPKNEAAEAKSSPSERGTTGSQGKAEYVPTAEEYAGLMAEYEKQKAEYERQKDWMLRTVAEFENSKKRAEREKEEFLKYASESFVKDLIPAIDSIERALASVKASKDFDALVEGVDIIHKQLLSVLEKRGVTPIEAVGEPFDPNLHEAIAHIESDEVPENRIIEEWRRGYMLHNRVIRPSMVAVSKGKGAEEETANE